MDYPLQLSFKLLALAPQIYVRDRAGQLRMYVKQKLLKLKEQVTVFAARSDTDASLPFNSAESHPASGYPLAAATSGSASS